MRRTGYQNAVLTAIAVILALGLIERHSGTVITEPAAASAQPESEGGMTNKLEQNKQMIAELRLLNQKLDRMDSRLAAGLNVKVTSMPPIQVNGGAEKREKNKGGEEAPAQPAPKPASK
jgi:hypothetical protein